MVEIDANEPVVDAVDIALYDAFAQPESDQEAVQVLVDSPRSRRVVVYTWNFHPDLIEQARQQGVRGYLSKTLSAAELVAALEAVHAGESSSATTAPAPDSKPRSTATGRARRRAQRARVGDPRPHHPGPEQRRDRRAHLPQPQHDQVLHPRGVPEDRRGQPDPGGAVGRRPRLHARPPAHRPLARRTLTRQTQRGLPARRVRCAPGGLGQVSAVSSGSVRCRR